ncbi:MAG: DoxX family protein [Mycobacteriales bacterium]
MTFILWAVSGLLGVVFLGSGVAKATMSRERLLATGQSAVALFPMRVVRVVAISEVAAVVGLFAPWLLDVDRVLTPVAALGLCVFMGGAALSHASLREPKQVAVNLTLLVLAGFLAAARIAQLS